MTIPKIKTHYSQAPRVITTSELENMTEQKHAERLTISHMIKHGLEYIQDSPKYGDFTDIPSLDRLLGNRRRLNQVFSELPPNVRRTFDSVDHFVNVLREDDLELYSKHNLVQKIVKDSSSSEKKAAPQSAPSQPKEPSAPKSPAGE